jgi:BlaI family penicillinase repressor
VDDARALRRKRVHGVSHVNSHFAIFLLLFRLTYELISTIQLVSMRPKHTTLTPQELEIMKLVWRRESATVRDIYEELLEHRKIAYTTVMTMMKILETKGYLKKRRQDRAFIYRPAHPKNQVIGGMIREFMDRVFNGSAEPLLVHLVKSGRIREKDLQAIARMIEETK